MRKTIGNFFIIVVFLGFLFSFSYDVIRWLGSGSGFLRLGEFWYLFHASSLNLLQAIIQRYVWAPLWDNFFVMILILPVWFFIAIMLIILIYYVHGRRQ